MAKAPRYVYAKLTWPEINEAVAAAKVPVVPVGPHQPRHPPFDAEGSHQPRHRQRHAEAREHGHGALDEAREAGGIGFLKRRVNSRPINLATEFHRRIGSPNFAFRHLHLLRLDYVLCAQVSKHNQLVIIHVATRESGGSFLDFKLIQLAVAVLVQQLTCQRFPHIGFTVFIRAADRNRTSGPRRRACEPRG